MTTSKIAFVVAAIVPFGFVILACIGIAHVALGGLRDRKRRQAAMQPVVTQAAA